MKNFVTTVFAGCALVAAATATDASTSAGRFASEEFGLITCATYMQAKAKKLPIHGSLIAYVQGYMTAANRYEPNTFDLTPWHNSATFGVILDRHCRSNPKDTITGVSQKLVTSMTAQRLTESSPRIAIKDGANETLVYEAILKRAQGELAKKGMYKGPADGRFTPQTKTAVAAFQKSAKLMPTGVPDPATLWILLNP